MNDVNEKSFFPEPEDLRGDRVELIELWDELIEGIRDHNIARFLEYFIINGTHEMFRKFFTSPAARSENPGHHAFKGGLAYHTLNAAKLAGQIADHYNALHIKVNRDMVIAGVILHDIGKVDCYKWEEGRIQGEIFIPAGYTHTEIGKSFHHIPHGFQLFMAAAKDFNEVATKLNGKHVLTEKKIRLLGHIILSHHGRRSWSSPVVPNNIEAYIVHLVEMGDAMVDKYNKGEDVRDIYDH